MSQIHYIDPATEGMKETATWYSARLEQETQLIRWGFFGTPMLLFPTAGGDAAEVERFFLIKVLEPLIHAGRLKVYSIDSIAGRTWLTNDNVAHCVWVQKQFDHYLIDEVIPAIRHDCRSPQIEVITAGASIGAFNALLAICRHPQIFSHAICMSGTYDLQKWLQGQWFDDYHYYSPLHFVPGLSEGPQLQQLRKRMVYLPTGQGKYEDPGESWKVAHVLGVKGIPNRVDLWDPQWEHDWVTWRKMLPQYCEEIL
ncbi:MAG TPA: alpha/beta hydrolase-fold protein [Pirellulaceae bacterium]|nr:alpha/beta hydrolase-fold protein [Pirellulaceae bacterium]